MVPGLEEPFGHLRGARELMTHDGRDAGGSPDSTKKPITAIAPSTAGCSAPGIRYTSTPTSVPKVPEVHGMYPLKRPVAMITGKKWNYGRRLFMLCAASGVLRGVHG